MTRAAAATPADPCILPSASWAERVRSELVGNILPFWPRYVTDKVRGGFFGTVGADLKVQPGSVRTIVVNSRILWTYAAAARLVPGPWRETADHAFDYLVKRFWDNDQGGVYWWLDGEGAVVDGRKQTYAQAFAIYAFAEYVRLTGNGAALDFARRLFALIEQHCYDPVHGGYIEARGRDWQPLDDMRLSERDLNCPKSMNTHLHILEAYTNLIRVWPDETLKARQRELIAIMLDRVVDGENGRFKLFFDREWHSLLDRQSFGHDIEGSWLLVEAADVLGDRALLGRARRAAVAMAQSCLNKGLDADGSMVFEADADGTVRIGEKHWWVQAEAVIGFYNAWQITGQARFREASLAAWNYIENHVVDREHGEWHAKLRRDGSLVREADDPEATLVGPWKCPYHNARVCYEMMERLGRNEKNAS